MPDTKSPPPTHCAHCGEPIDQPVRTGKHPKRFCNPQCKARYWNAINYKKSPSKEQTHGR